MSKWEFDCNVRHLTLCRLSGTVSQYQWVAVIAQKALKNERHMPVCRVCTTTYHILRQSLFRRFSHYLFECRHAADLRVELGHLLAVESLGHLHEGAPLVGAALLVPVRPRGHELGGAHDVDAAELAQEQVLFGDSGSESD